MLNKIIQNAGRPQGFFGKVALWAMNKGHVKLWAWGLNQVIVPEDAHILDLGCGGGANIRQMLTNYPNSTVDGLDLSETSVQLSRKLNKRWLGKRCTIQQGHVANLPYPDHSLDLITAFETVYFWPEPPLAMREARRALKNGGKLLICCEVSDPLDTTWTDKIPNMRIHSGAELTSMLEQAGFELIQLSTNSRGWIALVCTKN